MSIKSDKKKQLSLKKKKHIKSSDFLVISLDLSRKIFIPYSHFRKNYPSSCKNNTLTKEHIEILKKEVE
ncbi:MAG: hypothetical protein BAJALOKI1v1_430017 [Promethearchaeota archaeon]|nr:MAG: hypothetical protein BAJALOKI1v1_430017 [Candidatus Lokiarchaeota archaeon]